MLRFLVVRITHGAIVIAIVSVLVFLILHLAPGDPVQLLIGDAQMTREQIEQIRIFWGLDQPLYVQYFKWIGNILQGNLGESIAQGGRPVTRLLADTVPNTLLLNVLALVIAIAIAIPAGVVSAVKRYSIFDSMSILLSTIGVSVPNFWLGLMLIVLFSLQLGWLPATSTNLSDPRRFILPVVVLAVGEMALFARLMRSTTLEVMGLEYVATARAKGLAEAAVLFRHIVRNALLPIVTVIGFRLSFLVSGAVVVETVFAWPGVGQLLFQSITRRDYQVVQGVVLLLTLMVVVGNLLTDLVYAYIDPRIRVT